MAPRGAPGTCLDLPTAEQIVQDASDGPHDMDKTLEEVGLITDNHRARFRQRVRRGVVANGCEIDIGDIPNDADTVLADVRDDIQAAAEPGR